MIRDALQDLRYGLRSLRRSPGFTVMVILSLAVGIGANAAVFSLLNFVFLRPLAVRNPGGLVLFSDAYQAGDTNAPYRAGNIKLYPAPLYQRLREQNQSFAGLAAQQSGHANVVVRWEGPADDASAELGVGRAVTANYFGVLDVAAYRGRTFLPEDQTAPDANPVVVLSHSYWQRRFDGNPALIGARLTIRGIQYTVIGVAAPGFSGTRVGVEVTDFWVPMTMHGALTGRRSLMSDAERGWLVIAGRLNPGVSMEAAEAEANVALQQFLAGAPSLVPEQQARQRTHIALVPGGRGISPLRQPNIRAPLMVAMAAVGLLLLIVCLNVSHLLLARALDRHREMSIRTALGATRARLVRQLLTEGLLLAAAGGAGAVLATSWMTAGLLSLVPAGLPLTLDVPVDGRVLAFTGLLAAAIALLLGLVPAWQASSLRLQPALQGTSSTVAGGSRLVSRVLLTSQVALSLVLLVSAALCAQTLGNLRQLGKGFDEEHVLLVEMKTNLADLPRADVALFHDEVLRRVSGLPGVRNASLSQLELLGGSHSRNGISVDGAPALEADFGTVTAAYFQTLGMPLARGRGFGAADREGSPPVAVINRTLERRLFGGNALGRRFKKTGREFSEAPPVEVVGVVEDSKNNGVREDPVPMVYRPVAQDPTPLGSLQVLAAGDPALLADQVRRAVREAHPAVPVVGVRTMRSQVDRALTGERALATLSSSVGLLALFLVSIGLYGVISQWAAQRTREIGVRVALGATTAGVRWLVMRQAFVLVGAGLLVGLPAAFAVARLLRGFLFGLGPTDPVSLTGAALLMFAVATVAAYLPARRASRVDPMTALRCE